MSNPLPSDPKPQRPPLLGCLTTGLAGTGAFIALLMIFAMAAFLFLPMVFDGTGPGADKHQAVGRELPALDLQPLGGAERAVHLADVKGQVVLVSFWGTWCPPCRRELPILVGVAQKFRDEGDFRFLAVSCGRGGRENLEQLRAETQAYLERSQLEVSAYADPQQITRQAFDSIGQFQGYPTTFLLDRRGVVQRVWVGYHARVGQELERIIPTLLRQSR